MNPYYTNISALDAIPLSELDTQTLRQKKDITARDTIDLYDSSKTAIGLIDSTSNYYLNFSSAGASTLAENLNKPKEAFWYSVAYSSVIVPYEYVYKESKKFHVEVVKEFSLLPEVRKIYLVNEVDFISIDIIFSNSYITNELLERAIRKEIVVHNQFSDILLHFSYKENDLNKDPSAVKIYESNG